MPHRVQNRLARFHVARDTRHERRLRRRPRGRAGRTFHEDAGIIALAQQDVSKGKGTILIVAAGTADLSVAEEAARTAELMGNDVARLYDVGVAGLHRLLTARPMLESAQVIVVVAGMEGALPSVVAGLVPRPVVAVPTSIGYGASFGGIAALLGMLNTCASGVSVVNIDNGFGAGAVASLINHLIGLTLSLRPRLRYVRIRGSPPLLQRL